MGRLSYFLRIFKCGIVGLSLSLFASYSLAFVSVKRDFNELVALADIVLVGSVKELNSQWQDPVSQDVINTYITFADLDVLKGNITEDTYTIRIAGGDMPPYRMRILGAPEFKLHQRYTVFIKDNQQVVFPFVGIHDGIFVVDSLPDGRSVVKTLAGDIVSKVADSQVITLQAGTKNLSDEAVISFEDFRLLIQQRLGNSHEK